MNNVFFCPFSGRRKGSSSQPKMVISSVNFTPASDSKWQASLAGGRPVTAGISQVHLSDTSFYGLNANCIHVLLLVAVCSCEKRIASFVDNDIQHFYSQLGKHCKLGEYWSDPVRPSHSTSRCPFIGEENTHQTKTRLSGYGTTTRSFRSPTCQFFCNR